MIKFLKFNLGPSRIRLGPNHAQGFVTGVLITISFFLGFIFKTGFNECAQAAKPSTVVKYVTPKGKDLAALCARFPQSVVPAPILPAPDFEADLEEVIEANKEGTATVTWNGVDQARSYRVKVFDLNGKVIRSLKTSNRNLKLKNLPVRSDIPFTEFKVSVITINADGKEGGASEPRKLIVRRPIDLTAPTIKSIKVED